MQQIYPSAKLPTETMVTYLLCFLYLKFCIFSFFSAHRLNEVRQAYNYLLENFGYDRAEAFSIKPAKGLHLVV